MELGYKRSSTLSSVGRRTIMCGRKLLVYGWLAHPDSLPCRLRKSSSAFGRSTFQRNPVPASALEQGLATALEPLVGHAKKGSL